MSATVPIELTFGSGGNLKAARRLRGLDLKDRLNNINNGRGGPSRPVFANTGQIIKKAQRAGPIIPRGGGVRGTGSSIHSKSSIPPGAVVGASDVAPPTIQGLPQQGDVEGGGTVVPEQIADDIQQGALGEPATAGRISGKTLAIGGGIAVIALGVVYFLFFKKRKGRKHKRKK